MLSLPSFAPSLPFLPFKQILGEAAEASLLAGQGDTFNEAAGDWSSPSRKLIRSYVLTSVVYSAGLYRGPVVCTQYSGRWEQWEETRALPCRGLRVTAETGGKHTDSHV